MEDNVAGLQRTIGDRFELQALECGEVARMRPYCQHAFALEPVERRARDRSEVGWSETQFASEHLARHDRHELCHGGVECITQSGVEASCSSERFVLIAGERGRDRCRDWFGRRHGVDRGIGWNWPEELPKGNEDVRHRGAKARPG